MIAETLVADALTPVSAYAALRREDPAGASCLLESVLGGERWGRFSVLMFAPARELRLTEAGWVAIEGGIEERLGDFTSGWEAIGRTPRETGDLAARFAAAHYGYFSWELTTLLAKVARRDGDRRPLARLFDRGTVSVFDNLAQTVTVMAERRDQVARALKAFASPPELSLLAPPDRAKLPERVTLSQDDSSFQAGVLRAKEYIAAGDAFQIVLARTFEVPREGRDPFDVYRAMRLINPSPYMYYLDLPPVQEGGARLQIAGASPETMVRREGERITVRPIAGTRPRGRTAEEDALRERQLRADPKERAEHVMLIDLGRNDVGRLATTGSVQLVRDMEIERYSHVMHLVSEVEGRVPEATSALDVVRATFPAGTLSGAPKVRAMQIIRELEGRRRGIYGGAVGYLAADGDLDLAIAIRTAVCEGDTFEVTAGAGVVEASDPIGETAETRNKARGVLAAIAAAGG